LGLKFSPAAGHGLRSFQLLLLVRVKDTHIIVLDRGEQAGPASPAPLAHFSIYLHTEKKRKARAH
jgi:hypothetical protein